MLAAEKRNAGRERHPHQDSERRDRGKRDGDAPQQ
jgi:hypothetical protein